MHEIEHLAAAARGHGEAAGIYAARLLEGGAAGIGR
jgi:hypothetical protein